MNRYRSVLLLGLVWLGLHGACVTLHADEDQESVIESFLLHVQALDSIAQDQIQNAVKTVEEYRQDSAADAITETLIVLYPKYAAAIEASDSDDATAIENLFTPFTQSKDSYLAADACFYLARAQMNNEQFEDAIPLLDRIHGALGDYTVHSGYARFYTGVAQAGLLRYNEAILSLKDFLQFYPNAPERLRVAAWRQIQQLQAIKAGQLEDVYQRMDFSRRRLSLIEPGEETQAEQDKIVSMLAKLIKEEEKKEASSSSKDQKNTKKQQQKKQQQQAQQKPQPSKSQTGGSSRNSNGQVVKKSYDNGPASPWSRLRDRSRDPANNAIKEKLPARYRDIVERYYEAANRDSKR